MPTTTSSETRRFSANLLYQAGKGKFSTARRPIPSSDGAQQNTSQSDSNESSSHVVSSHVVNGFKFRAAPLPPSVSPPSVATQGASDVVADAHESTEATAPAEAQASKNEFFSAIRKQKELRITAAASKALARLFAALSLDPGCGAEVPLDLRKQVLDVLVRESHQLAESVSLSVMGGQQGDSPPKVPIYLRAKLLQQSAEFISNQWIRFGTINTKPLQELAHEAFSGNVRNITQEVVDLFHTAEEYTPATNQELSQARITSSVMRASWNLLQQVQKVDLRHYDPDLDAKSPAVPFTWGRSVHEVTHDLTKITLSIAKENEISLDDLDMATTWTQNTITRASMLVRSEYQMITERALRASFKDPLLSEARMGQLHSMYDDMLAKIGKRARQSYLTIERNAVDAMAASAYTSYLPKAKKPESTESNHAVKEQENVSFESEPKPEIKASTFRFPKPFSAG